MHVWHLTSDAPRVPHRPSPGERVELHVGTWPIEEGQSVVVEIHVEHAGGGRTHARVDAEWIANRGPNSYWRAVVGPFARGDVVRFVIEGRSQNAVTAGPRGSFRVGPRLHVALLWHQHQPVYRDTLRASGIGAYSQPWVRLHALRDYVGMPWIVSRYPDLHLTINLTPSLLWQVDDYIAGATDRDLDLLLRDPASFTSDERREVVMRSFDADPVRQIGLSPRYRELFAKKESGGTFSDEDLRDLTVWFSLAWFSKELREGVVDLATGERASVKDLVEKDRGFDADDVRRLVFEQRKMLRAIVPTHRALQEKGQIEVSTTPFFHPILPLLVDTDRATLDRQGASLPKRFAWPEDAEAQVRRAADYYESVFGRRPRGMWPAEGAVSQFVVPYFAGQGIAWIATDRGVLARSGRYGYAVDDPDVLCRPYRVEESDASLTIFFRDTRLSDDIGFVYGGWPAEDAAAKMIDDIQSRFANVFRGDGDRVLTIAVDGENAWGGYESDGRPFLDALYRRLTSDDQIQTVTFSEYLGGNASRAVLAHPKAEQTRVYELFTGSWIDEAGSAPGVDLGTWIGEDEENRAWEILGEARAYLAKIGATPESAPKAYEALYIAEGSDWFWWFGDDQDSGHDWDFDDLFRLHVANVYRAVGAEPPASLARPIVPHAYPFRFGERPPHLREHDRLTVRTACPGVLMWSFNDGAAQASKVSPVQGVMANVVGWHTKLTVPSGARELRIAFRCEREGCTCKEGCCTTREAVISVVDEASVHA